MRRLLGPGGRDAVAVLLVGDELLLGSVADTNGAWLAQACTSAGLRVAGMEVVPDDTDLVAAAVQRRAGTVGTLVLSGGIGPTSDDVTRQALARACGCALVRDPEAETLISGWFAAHGRRVPAGALRMAERPRCARMVLNPHGSAPGVALELGGTQVYAVPGVPGELRSMVSAAVLPDVLARSGLLRPTLSASVEVALLGESAVAARLADVEAEVATDPAVDLAYLARPAHVSVRVSVRGEDSDAARARLDGLVARAEAALGADVMGRDGVTLPSAVLDLLLARHETVACAESLTGGAVCAALTSVPGSSVAVRGGVVAYSADAKRDLLGVDPGLVAAHGTVHPEVAKQMAQGARGRLGAEWGVATTGVAGPDGWEGHEPGEVHVAVAGPAVVRARMLQLPGERRRVRGLGVAHALDLLRHCLLAEGGGESRPAVDR